MAHVWTDHQLIFVEIAIAKERERCATIAESYPQKASYGGVDAVEYNRSRQEVGDTIAEAIRNQTSIKRDDTREQKDG